MSITAEQYAAYVEHVKFMTGRHDPDWDESPGETVQAMVQTSEIENAATAMSEWAEAFRSAAKILNADYHYETRDVFLWMADKLDVIALVLDIDDTDRFDELNRLGIECSEEIDTVFNAVADELEYLDQQKPIEHAAAIVEMLRAVDRVWMAVCDFNTWDELNERTDEIAKEIGYDITDDGDIVYIDPAEICRVLVFGMGSKDDPIEVE